MADEELTVKQVAELLDRDQSAVLRAIQRGRLDARRLGDKMWLITPAAVEVYVRTQPAGEKRGRKKGGASV